MNTLIAYQCQYCEKKIYKTAMVELMATEQLLDMAKKALESADRVIKLNDIAIENIKVTLNDNK